MVVLGGEEAAAGGAVGGLRGRGRGFGARVVFEVCMWDLCKQLPTWAGSSERVEGSAKGRDAYWTSGIRDLPADRCAQGRPDGIVSSL